MLEQFLIENAMSFWFQVGEVCRATGLTFHQDGDTIIFIGESSHPLAIELLLNTYQVGTWNVNNRNIEESTEKRDDSTTEPELAQGNVSNRSDDSSGRTDNSELQSDIVTKTESDGTGSESVSP